MTIAAPPYGHRMGIKYPLETGGSRKERFADELLWWSEVAATKRNSGKPPH